LTLRQAIDLFESAHARLFALLCVLQEEQWDRFVRNWVNVCTWEHFDTHTEEIRTWKKLRSEQL